MHSMQSDDSIHTCIMLKLIKSGVDAEFKQSFRLNCVLKEMLVLRIFTNKFCALQAKMVFG